VTGWAGRRRESLCWPTLHSPSLHRMGAHGGHHGSVGQLAAEGAHVRSGHSTWPGVQNAFTGTQSRDCTHVEGKEADGKGLMSEVASAFGD